MIHDYGNFDVSLLHFTFVLMLLVE